MKYKAVLTDLDGTAVDTPTERVASERLAKAVQAAEASGLKICAATGRPVSWADLLFKSMKLSGPSIVSGGARIVNAADGKELWKMGLSEAQMKAILAIARENAYGCLWNDYEEDDYYDGGWDPAKFDAFAASYFFEIIFVPNERSEALVRQLEAVDGVTVTRVVGQRPQTTDLHVSNEKATKEHAVYELEKIIGVAKEAMIGVGDGHNDLHLFSAVGHRVAVANAVPDLKAKADQVIGDVKDDGLAAFLEKLAETGGEI